MNEIIKPNVYYPLNDKEKNILEKNGINSDYIRRCNNQLITLHGIKYIIDDTDKLIRII